MNSVVTFWHSRKLGLTLVMPMSYLCANYNSTRNLVDEEPLCGSATPKMIIYLFARKTLNFAVYLEHQEARELARTLRKR